MVKDSLLETVCINGIEGFWSFSNKRLMKYHGVNPKKFQFYCIELEFLYNHRHHDLYADLVKCISEYSRVAYSQESPFFKVYHLKIIFVQTIIYVVKILTCNEIIGKSQ